MKRNKENGNNDSPTYNGNVVFSSTKKKFDSDENDNMPPQVAPRSNSIAPPVPTERKLSYEESNLIDGDDTLHNIGTYVQEEIHPGVMLEGYAVEL